MKDRRQYFRIKNDGAIQASHEGFALKVIDMSSSGALVIKNDHILPEKGELILTTNNNSMKMHYEILKIGKEYMTLIFIQKNEIDTLFWILKELKDNRLDWRQ